MVSVTEFFSDYELYENEMKSSDELDLSFLEAIESAENVFGINKTYFEALKSLTPKRELIPTLHDSVFEEPLEHAVWTSSAWPRSSRHFPA